VPRLALEHRSNNLSKWEYPNAVYQRVLTRYLDRLYHLFASTGARRVLDAGCGEGVVYRAMRDRGFRGEWTGVDVSEGAVAYARTRSPEAQWLTAPLDRLPFAPASFDTVLCSQVLEHVPNPHAALNGIADVSSRQLVVSVPWEPAFRTLTALSIAVGVGQDPGHVNFWNGARFRRVLGTVGRVVAWERSAVYQLAIVDTSRNASA
jgi:2-polyprenyl-3-methyl-5-hydroxy-6-metoxy-1,4-benzoquinol methylase